MPPELKDTFSSAIEDQELSKEDMIDLLADDEELETEEDEAGKKDDKKESKKEEEIEIDETEEESEKESDKEDESDEDEFQTPVSRKEILAKYPDIFKNFPQLQKSMYRDREFTEMFGDPKDAKEILEKAQSLDEFQTDLLGGNTQKLLHSIKSVDEKAFNKIIDNYLPVLEKVDKEAFYHVVGTVVDNIVLGMVNEARRMGKENGQPLESAATILNQFMNGTTEFKPRGRLATEESKDSESAKLQEEREQFIQEKFETKRDELDSRVSNLIKSTIEKNIDPKGEMSDYVKRAAIRDAIESLDDLIDGDESYQKIKDKLWEGAFKDNFSNKSIDRVKSAHLSKAKTLLKDVIRKSRNNALKGPGKREERDRSGKLPVGRATTDKSTKLTSSKEIPKGMKTLDFLMQD